MSLLPRTDSKNRGDLEGEQQQHHLDQMQTNTALQERKEVPPPPRLCKMDASPWGSGGGEEVGEGGNEGKLNKPDHAP